MEKQRQRELRVKWRKQEKNGEKGKVKPNFAYKCSTFAILIRKIQLSAPEGQAKLSEEEKEKDRQRGRETVTEKEKSRRRKNKLKREKKN